MESGGGFDSTVYRQPEVEIEIPDGADPDLLRKINVTLRQFPGETPIAVLIPSGESFRKMTLAFKVNAQGELIQNIEQILGPNTIKLV